MKVHELKTINPYFESVWRGFKDFEVRKNDRDFNVGDRVKLVESGQLKHNIPRFIIKDIKYILKGGQYGIDEYYVILGLRDI